MNLKRLSIAVALLVVLAPSLALPQSLTGSIQGVVKDEQGGALPGASVTLAGVKGTRTAVSDAAGSYRFPAVAKYSVPRFGHFTCSTNSSRSPPLATKSRLRVSTTSSGERL